METPGHFSTEINNEWADDNKSIGPGYGKQWRKWQGPDGREIDQIADVVHTLKNNPNSRRIFMSAWNVSDLDKMKLPPCHVSYQWFVADGKLSCHLYQRSQDQLALSYNACTASILTMMLAQVCGYQPGHFVHSWGDVHIYSNHVDAVKTMISREPRPLPRLEMDPSVREIDDFRFGHFNLVDYEPHPNLVMPVAV